MVFDPTITLGSVLILVGNAAIFVIYIIRMEGKLNLLTLRTTNLEQAVDALAKTDTRLATFEERLSNHGKMLATAQSDISDLRKGKGFITNRNANSVEGEY